MAPPAVTEVVGEMDVILTEGGITTSAFGDLAQFDIVATATNNKIILFTPLFDQF